MHAQATAMQTLRRLYVYIVTAATLVFAAIGAANLLRLGLDRLFTAVSGEDWIRGGPDWQREQLSLYLPFVIIAAPIWFLHWRMAQRAVSGDPVTERRSIVRNLFFALVIAITGLQLVLDALMSLVELAVAASFDRHLQAYERDSLVTSLATLIVCAAIWAFHLRAWLGDVRAETAETRETLPVPVVLFVAAVIGLLLSIFGARELIGVAVDAVAGNRTSAHWWRDPLARSTATLVTGAAIWALHWPLTERLRRSSPWWGRGRDGSSLRRAFLVAIPTVTAVIALVFFGQGIDGIVRWTTDVPPDLRESDATLIATPLLAMFPPIGIWLLHRRLLLAEPTVPGVPIAAVTIQRLLGYAMALVGLALATIGGANVIGEAVQEGFGESDWRRDIGWPLGVLLGGGLLWGWYWRQTRQRLARDPDAEQVATSRRAYLLLTLGGAVVALMVSVAMAIYQVLQRVLDVGGTGGLAEDIALPLGITLATATVALCHGLLLRRDLAVRPIGGRAESESRIDLVLTAPAGADVEGVVRMLRRDLPEGYALETRSRPADAVVAGPEDVRTDPGTSATTTPG